MTPRAAYLQDLRRYPVRSIVTEAGVMSYGTNHGRWSFVLTGLFTATLLAALLVYSPFARAEGEEDSLEEETPTVQNEKNTNGFFPAENPWFNEGDAKTVFSAEPVKSDSAQVGFYKEREEKKEVEEDQFQQPQVIQAGAQQQPSRPPFDTRKAKPDQLIAFFGNPNEDAALTPEDNAPKPFKAMMAAMDSGNDELAYKYARQYVRYLRNLESRVARVSDFAEIAVEREGIREGYLKNNPYKHLLTKDLESEEQSPSAIGEALSRLDPESADILRMAQADEDKALGNFEQPVHEIPVDPKGEVDVLFFFKVGEEASGKMAQALQKIRDKLALDQTTNFTGYILNQVSNEARQEFLEVNGVNFKVKDGQAAVGALGIRISPTVVFVARNAKKSYRIEDIKTPAEMFAVIMQMKGGAK